VVEALIAQGIDAGVPKNIAEVESRDRRLLPKLLDDILVAPAHHRTTAPPARQS